MYIPLCHPFLQAIKHYLFLPEWRRVMNNQNWEQQQQQKPTLVNIEMFLCFRETKEYKEEKNKAGKDTQEV